MKDSEIFIIGANGQLGKALQQKYPGAISADLGELDITNQDSVLAIDWSTIKYIMNAAAYTNVDAAESHEGRIACWGVNAQAVANLVKIANKYDITFVHVSTDYIFDGSQEKHAETEKFSPLSVYGSSKAAGDLAVTLAKSHYIIRTSWVIGEGKNFVRTMMELAENNISPTVVHDQIGKLTFTSELVRATDHLLTHDSEFGTYNVSNDGEPVSWADIAREIFSILGRDDLTVANISTSEYFADKVGMAPRPLNSTLDLSKIQATGFVSKPWSTELKNYIKGEKS